MLKDTLNTLFQQMELLSPNTRDFLLPGLSDEEISHLENLYHITLPRQLKETYGVFNGFSLKAFGGVYNSITFPTLEYRMLPLEDAFKLRARFLRTDAIPDYSTNWLPIFSDDFYNYLIADLSSEGIRVAKYFTGYWENYDEAVMFPSLEDFFLYVTELYKNDCYTLDADHQLQEDNDLALKTALAMFDLPYWKEQKMMTTNSEQNRSFSLDA